MVMVFKTSVSSTEDIEMIRTVLNRELPHIKWNFDLEDCDNIFRVESWDISAKVITHLFNTLGFTCSELE